MAEVPTFFSGLVGGLVGAAAAVDVPAEGERAARPAPGTCWGSCCGKLHESARELDGFVQQLTFVLGKLALGLRVGVTHLGCTITEGRCPTTCCAPLDKADVDQGIDAGKQGAEALVRGGRLAIEALVEGAKVAATRALLVVEGSKDILVRNIPYTQDKLGQVYASFLRGYQGGAGRSVGYYQAPVASYQQHQSSPPPSQQTPPLSYQQQSYQQQPPYQQPPPSTAQPSGGFFW